MHRDNKIKFYQIIRVKFEWQGEVQYEEYSKPGMVGKDDSLLQRASIVAALYYIL